MIFDGDFFDDPNVGPRIYPVNSSFKFRFVICPNGEILLMDATELELVPEHLQSWGLPIADFMLDQ